MLHMQHFDSYADIADIVDPKCRMLCMKPEQGAEQRVSAQKGGGLAGKKQVQDRLCLSLDTTGLMRCL